MKTTLPGTDERFRLLIESVVDYAIFILDLHGLVSSWSSGAKRLMDYEEAEIVGQHFSKFYTAEEIGEEKPADHLECARTEGRMDDQGWRVRRDGSRFWANVSISPIRLPSGKLAGFAHVLRDSAPINAGSDTPENADGTRIQRMEAAKVAAEKANQAKDDFLALLSHELRTPLTPALAAAGYLLDHASRLPPDFQEEVATIQRNVQLEARLIDDLLDLTRIVRGKIELHFEIVEAHRVLHEIIEVVGDDIIEKELDVRICLSATEHTIWADPVRIRQVFWNLIRNAVKFTPARGQIDVRSINDDDGRFQLQVADNGIGIDPQHQSDVFNAFEQGSRAITREFGGLGLGLTISKRLLDLHHGTIVVESAGINRGTSFKVTLDTLSKSNKTNEQHSNNGAGVSKSLRLLLVEDHADTRRTLSRLLTRCGHKVTSTDHVESALKLLESKRFDAVVSDIGLPDRSGYELMALAKQRHKLKGIALSGFGMEEDIRRSLAAGFDRHLTKPVDFRNLRMVLDEIVA